MKIVKTLGAAGLLALALGKAAFAAGVDINADPNDVMIHGYDPVAYFSDGNPTVGKSEFTQVYKGGIYRFSSAANRDAFAAAPAKYAPAYGGYCALGTSMGKKFDGDPTAWKIVDGTLYLNLNKDVQKKWLSDVPGYIQEANVQWPEIKNTAAKDL